MKLAVIITTINGSEHGSLPSWREWCRKNNAELVVVGDRKTPRYKYYPGQTFISIDEQHARWPVLSRMIPENTYCRKNLGYLHAAEAGFTHLFDTDDDNSPLTDLELKAEDPVSRGVYTKGQYWVNTFANFGEPTIWPRGGQFNALAGGVVERPGPVSCPVRQYMCDLEPDRDAVQRIAHPETKCEEYRFRGKPFALCTNAWAPINTQSTMISVEEALHLAYIPWTCSHRCTDILRGWLMLPALWREYKTVSFHPSAVYQERNDHDLAADLRSELPMYSLYDKVPLKFTGYIEEDIGWLIGIGFCREEELASRAEYLSLVEKMR